MLRSWLYFLSFFYTVNSFSTEEEKVKKECNLCYEDKDSRLLIEPKEIFSCQCVDVHICKKCILGLIGEKINLKKEKELTEKNKKIKILELIFGYIKDEIKNRNYDLQNFVEDIIKKKEKIEEKEKKEKEKKECEDIKIGEYKQLNAEEKLVYRAINKEEDKVGNIIFYIGDEKEPTEKLKFIKSFLSLLKQFNEDSHKFFKRDIERSIQRNCNNNMDIKEIEEWKEKDVDIEVSCRLDTTELQKKEFISIKCPYCRRVIEKESAFFLKICEELSSQELSKKLIYEGPSSQESSKKPCCREICEGLCPFCC